MIDWEVASGCEFEGFFKLLSSWTPTTVKGGSAPQMTTPLPLDPVDPADPLHALINSKFDLVLQQQGAQHFVTTPLENVKMSETQETHMNF